MEDILSFGGKSNSLGKVNEIIIAVLNDKALLHELYSCLFSVDPWVRMRAVDAFEKICRVQPSWVEPYVDKIQTDLSDSAQQPSIQWHIAQIYPQINLTMSQKQKALSWLEKLLSSSEIDWIVAANAIKAIIYFTQNGDYPVSKVRELLKVQLTHKSDAIVKKAKKAMNDFS